MNKPRIILTGILLLAIAGLVLLAGRVRLEPVLEGRRLSDWITEIVMRRDAAHARLVLQETGTNAVPLLLEWATETGPARPSLKHQLIARYNREVGLLRARGLTNLAYFGRGHGLELDHQTLAFAALPELSPAGKIAAVQGLMTLMASTNEEVAGSACFALSKMPPESIDPLLGIFQGNDETLAETAGAALGMMGASGAPAVPALKKMLAAPRLSLRVRAAETLGEMGVNPVSLVPSLMQGFAELPDATDLIAKFGQAMQTHAKEIKPATNAPNAVLR